MSIPVPMTSMTSTMIQIVTIASTTRDDEALLRHLDSIQIALETIDRPVTAEAFIALSDIIDEGGDLFQAIPRVVALGTKAADSEPDSLTHLTVVAKRYCDQIRAGDNDRLHDLCVIASALTAWLSLVDGPNQITLIRVEDALLDIGRAIAGIAFVRLTGKIIPDALLNAHGPQLQQDHRQDGTQRH